MRAGIVGVMQRLVFDAAGVYFDGTDSHRNGPGHAKK
jgi:hypothetical protein